MLELQMEFSAWNSALRDVEHEPDESILRHQPAKSLSEHSDSNTYKFCRLLEKWSEMSQRK